MTDLIKPSDHSWKIRLGVGIVMLVLAFIGVIVTDLRKDGAWGYWRMVSLIFAVLSLSLSVCLKKMGWKKTVFTVWHEIFHWLGLVLATSVLAYFVDTGILGRFQAGIMALTLLALATYLAGVYIEITLVPIGLLLGVFAAGTVFFATYLYSVIIPLTLLGVFTVILIARQRKAS